MLDTPTEGATEAPPAPEGSEEESSDESSKD